MTEIQKNTVRKVHDAFEKNDATIMGKINSIFGVPTDLTGTLLEKFSALGDNPIVEATLSDTLTTEGGLFKFARALTDRFDIKSSDFDTIEFSSFINKCRNKIMSYTYDDGTYKTTPNTENAKLPTFDDLEYISESSVEIRTLANEVANNYSDKVNDEFVKAQGKQIDYIYNLTGLDGNVLTDWEKTLVRENVIMYTANAVNTVTGRSL